MKSYFSRVVLPSTNMPDKSSYNIPELLKLLGISRPTLYRKIAKRELVMTKDKKVYRQELVNYFKHCDEESYLLRSKNPTFEK